MGRVIRDTQRYHVFYRFKCCELFLHSPTVCGYDTFITILVQDDLRGADGAWLTIGQYIGKLITCLVLSYFDASMSVIIVLLWCGSNHISVHRPKKITLFIVEVSL